MSDSTPCMRAVTSASSRSEKRWYASSYERRFIVSSFAMLHQCSTALAFFQGVCYTHSMSMDFSKLKEIAKKLGGILVMDGNVPELVVLSYENFSQMQQPAQTTQKSPEMPPEVPVHQHP